MPGEGPAETANLKVVRSQGEISFDAFLAGDAELIGAAGQILGEGAGLVWRPVGRKTLRVVAGWDGGAQEVSSPAERREATIERGEGLPGRAWETGRIVELGDCVAVPIPIGAPDRVQMVV